MEEIDALETGVTAEENVSDLEQDEVEESAGNTLQVEILNESELQEDPDNGEVDDAEQEANVDAVEDGGVNGFEPEDEIQQEISEEASMVEEEQSNIVPKKRGRKPKNANPPSPIDDDDDDDLPLRPRGRGRPRRSSDQYVLKEVKIEIEDISKNKKAMSKLSPTGAKRGRKPKPKDSPVVEVKEEVLPSVTNDQCRVCLKVAPLTSIFKRDGNMTILSKIATICPKVRILKDDGFPHSICDDCLQSLNVACNFKLLCERTDVDIKNSVAVEETKPAVRKAKADVKIEIESDLSEPEVDRDDDFKVSEHDSGSDDDWEKKPEAAPKRGRPRRGRPKKVVSPSDVINNDDDWSSGSEDNFSPPKKRGRKPNSAKKSLDRSLGKETQCPQCNEMFSSHSAFMKHKRTEHKESEIKCERCDRTFKHRGSWKMHMQRHENAKDANLECKECKKFFTTRTECRRHMIEVHDQPVASHVCDVCKKAFTTLTRLERHKESKCPGFASAARKKPELDNLSFGRDLFKCVAPLTTTYWSDSFSD